MALELAILGRAFWAPPSGEPEAYPDLPFLPSLFKRRLGQLDRMALYVGHEAIGAAAGSGAVVAEPALRSLRTVLATGRGEIGQQYRISSSLAESGEVSPAAFSLSVFNAPISLLSIAERNSGSASAVHAGEHSLAAALACAAAMLAADPAPVLLVAADELLPEAYAELAAAGSEAERGSAYALGLLLGPAAGRGEDLDLAFGVENDAGAGAAPRIEAEAFFDWLEEGAGSLRLGGCEWPVSLSRPGTGAACA